MENTKILVVSNTWSSGKCRVGHHTCPLSLTSPELSYVITVMGSIIINIVIVKYFAEKYNETIIENN